MLETTSAPTTGEWEFRFLQVCLGNMTDRPTDQPTHRRSCEVIGSWVSNKFVVRLLCKPHYNARWEDARGGTVQREGYQGGREWREKDEGSQLIDLTCFNAVKVKIFIPKNNDSFRELRRK